jgi:hypothetical protein
MALIAVYAVVNIRAAETRVIEIGRVPAPMALRALENRVVRGIGMAHGTNSVGAAMSQGEESVVEHRTGPGRRGVARHARRRE